ncbi:MAG: ABC transporter substrate-binding protein [Atopobiaceae bacterium]|nr:ABC transporter substrate-binding protein [Atopobiaceae bacterium]
MDKKSIRTTGNVGLWSRRQFVSGLVAAAAATAAMPALVACGSSSASSGSSSSGSSSDESYTLVEAGKLIVASDLAYPPMESVPDGATDPVGFEVDMMKEIASRLGLTCEYLPAQKFDTIIATIKEGGKADVGASSFTITDERKEEVDFTDSFMDSNQALVTRTDATDTTEDALNVAGKKIAVQSGTTGEDWAKENLTNATVVPLDDTIQALTGCQTGLYDAVVADLPVMKYECTNSYTDLQVAIEIPTGEQYGIVVSKDNPGLTKAINEALSDMDSDGTMDKLETNWFGSAL